MLEHIVVGLMAVICIASGIWGWSLNREDPSERTESGKKEADRDHAKKNK